MPNSGHTYLNACYIKIIIVIINFLDYNAFSLHTTVGVMDLLYRTNDV